MVDKDFQDIVDIASDHFKNNPKIQNMVVANLYFFKGMSLSFTEGAAQRLDELNKIMQQMTQENIEELSK